MSQIESRILQNTRYSVKKKVQIYMYNVDMDDLNREKLEGIIYMYVV